MRRRRERFGPLRRLLGLAQGTGEALGGEAWQARLQEWLSSGPAPLVEALVEAGAAWRPLALQEATCLAADAWAAGGGPMQEDEADMAERQASGWHCLRTVAGRRVAVEQCFLSLASDGHALQVVDFAGQPASGSRGLSGSGHESWALG